MSITTSLYLYSFFFFFNDTATTEIYTLSLHDALPISRADLALVAGDPNDPYGSLVRLRPAGVQLVMVDGRALYGDASLVAAGPAVPGCETISVCNASKFLCAAETSATNQLNETFAQITQV